jgi:divalent metal cation (Fe/Co/Zn/Cd) transporter
MHAEAELDVAATTGLVAAHALAHSAEAELVRTTPRLTSAVVHAYPEHAREEALAHP